MSPSDFGAILKPFVFLDLFDHEGPPFNGPLHPHSGIATLTYVAEGVVSYIDPDGERQRHAAGGRRRVDAGRDAACGTVAASTKQAGRAVFSCGLPCRRNSNWVRR